jgi:hypothetical protein
MTFKTKSRIPYAISKEVLKGVFLMRPSIFTSFVWVKIFALISN